MKKSKVRAIAFYLPQFYPTVENDNWWEPGFTEWTNVTRSKPLFKGHYQPRLPKDLGFYDLRVPEVREKQAEMARNVGIEGFCYWHYWFAGRRLLDKVFKDVVESGNPDYPFCLCWANHSWKAKTWTSSASDRMLIEQTYPGEEDYKAHFYAMLPAFKDNRYMRVDGKLLFGIFNPVDFVDFSSFAKNWNALASENGLNGFYFFALAQGTGLLNGFDHSLYDTIVFDKVLDIFYYKYNWLIKRYRGLLSRLKKPFLLDYNLYVRETLDFFSNNDSLVPCIDPDFDHSPRSAHHGVIFGNSSPEKWEYLCSSIMNIIESRGVDNNLLFIKSWNEWGEGNYLEPDQKYGHAYLNATLRALKS